MAMFWYDEEFNDLCRFGVRATETLFEEQSAFQKITILETNWFGRTLLIDDLFMTSERDEHYYHEMLVHPAMTTAPRIQRVLIIGGGDGGTAREILSYPEVEKVVMVEIDGKVVEACKKYLPKHGAWDDPRLEVIIGDGVDYAKNAEVEPFDVIFLDGSDPVGPAEGLFSPDFHEGIARLLGEKGVYALQSESPFVQREVFLETQKVLEAIFPVVAPYFGTVPIYASGVWSWTYATKGVSRTSFNEQRMAMQEERCKLYNRQIHDACFARPNWLARLRKTSQR